MKGIGGERQGLERTSEVHATRQDFSIIGADIRRNVYHCATPFHGVIYQSVVHTDGVFARAYIARLHSRISAVTTIQLPEPAALGGQKPAT
jgi:hypothetical protein